MAEEVKEELSGVAHVAAEKLGRLAEKKPPPPSGGADTAQ
jgi:hypothetical protein